jgi:hypothetical protein
LELKAGQLWQQFTDWHTCRVERGKTEQKRMFVGFRLPAAPNKV